MISVSGIRKCLLSALLLGACLAFVPEHAMAQDSAGIQVEPSATFTYGDRLTFEVHATAASVIVGARLTTQITNRSDIYSEAVSLFPGTTITASHSITTSALQLPPFAYLTYSWDFQDENGRQYHSDTQTLFYEDTSVPWEWVRTTQGQVTINTDGRDPALISSALEVTTHTVTQQSQLLGISYPNEIQVYVYPELAQLAASLRLHQQRVQDWVAAYGIPDQRIILIADAPGPEMLPNLQRDLPHEITHLVVYAAAGSNVQAVPGWFNEGLALTSATEPDPVLNEMLDNAVSSGILLSLEPLCASSFSNLPPHDAALAYAESESVVRYIVNRYGASQIQGLMSAYADGLSCSGGVELALGIPLSTLETQWHGDLSRTGVSSPRQDTSLAPWLLAWAISLILALLFVSPQPHQAEERSAYDTRAALTTIPDEPSGSKPYRDES